ncbi:hypothetical protein BH10PSE1_BH10PSE1_17330 [soil metagenome]
MKRLLILAAASAALLTSACGTTAKPAAIATTATPTWHQTADAKPFDAARTECWAETHGTARKGDFERCMSVRGWTQS